jgi:hypothetical protein
MRCSLVNSDIMGTITITKNAAKQKAQNAGSLTSNYSASSWVKRIMVLWFVCVICSIRCKF